MAWIFTDPVIQDLGGIDSDTTTQYRPLGTRARAKNTDTGDVAEFIYLEGCASTLDGDLVYWDGNFLSVRLPATSTSDTLPGVDLAAAMSPCVASEYGWYMLYGTHPNIIKGALVAEKVNLFTSSVAGAVQAATVSGRYIMGIKSLSSVNSTSTTYDTITAVLTYPRMNPKGGTPA